MIITGKYIINLRMIFILGMGLPIPFAGFAQTNDTIMTREIPEVIVIERYQTRETRSASPLQVLTKTRLESLNALQVSDAVKHFAGVTVKDYGGTGGLKTVSLRSLGAQHTAVGYDGITISDCQTGQTDIGRFSLDNIDRLTLSYGQEDNIFQPARFFASAGILNIQTLTPRFEEGKNTNLKGSFKTGSWGLANPSVLLEQRVGEGWALSANGEWMSADGRYPYTQYYGGENDSTSREKRKNTEVRTWRAEVGLFGNLTGGGQLRLKVYYYQSSRGLPGAATLYYDYAAQHLWDKNFFAQGQYRKEISSLWAFRASAKWNWSYQRYLDPDYKGLSGKTNNSYYQQEYYLSASLLCRATDRLSFSLSEDGSINTLNNNLSNPANPTRYSSLTAVAGKYENQRITASASLLATVVREEARLGAVAGNHHRLTPYVSASFKPFGEENFRIRVFYKDVFRLPSFNDLYYYEIGNTSLKPERASQYNAGITYDKDINRFVSFLSVTADAYYNKVRDKILAVPTQNLFVWSMVNLGEVRIKGLDTTVSAGLRPWKDISLNISANYTYQRALDTTDPAGKTYRHQIAYTPRVSASGHVSLETPWVNLSYSLLHAGKRYVLGQNLAANRLKGYSDHSISVSRNLKTGRTDTALRVEALNILDKNYEIVRYFPMPGRSLRATVTITY